MGKLWYFASKVVERKRYQWQLPLALFALSKGTSLFGDKKKQRDVPDPLASLRSQLQALAGQVPAQVAKQKELTAGRIGEARRTGIENILENLRAERGFGASSLEPRLTAELQEKLTRAQSEADLASDIWGTGEQARMLAGTARMYPSQPEEEEEEPSWATELLGFGSQMAVQNWMQEQQWKNFAKYFNPTTPTSRKSQSKYT